jgi:Na+/H+ antiporter NhaD/arsenite permease-like protein
LGAIGEGDGMFWLAASSTQQQHFQNHHLPTSVKVIFTLLLVAIIACLALEEKIHAKKSVITGIGALVCLVVGSAFHILPFGDISLIDGHHVAMPVYIPAIDWGVIVIIFGASLFVDVTSKSGLFSWIAIKLTKASGGDPWKLLFYYGMLTVLFSAVLNNVTAMLIVGSLTAVSLKKLGRSNKLLGFLLVEGLLTNVGGLLTLISSVPNIIVGNAAHMAFMEFFKIAAPYVVVSTLLTILLGARLFRIGKLTSEEEKKKAAKEVAAFDENDGIESKGFFYVSVFMFSAFILILSTTSLLPIIKDLNMGFVALAFAYLMLLRYKNSVEQFYRGIDWDLLLFFASLFVVINVMEHAQVLDMLGEKLSAVIGLGPRAGAASLLTAAAAASSVTDNIPLAAVLSKILGGMGDKATPSMWWAVVFGANLGGNITPIGSASTVVAVTIMHKYKLKMTFVDFVKMAFPFAIMQIVLAVLYVVLFIK